MLFNNMQTYLFFIFLLISIIPGVTAEDCIVEYIEGNLEMEQDDTWVKVEQGDVIPLTARLKTDDNTLAELSLGNQFYTISEKGIYSLDMIISNSKDAFSWNIGTVVGKKLAFIMEDEINQYEGSMGVRSEDSSLDSDEIDWMESSEFIVWEGQKLINTGKYENALSYFQQAFLDAVDENEGNEYLFYIGYCYELLGNKTQAFLTLSQIKVPQEASYYGHYVLLKSRLLAEGLSYQKALTLMNEYLDKFPDGVYAQAVNFLSAFCYKGMNNREKAIECLKRVYELDPKSAIGIEAAKQIKGLDNQEKE